MPFQRSFVASIITLPKPTLVNSNDAKHIALKWQPSQKRPSIAYHFLLEKKKSFSLVQPARDPAYVHCTASTIMATGSRWQGTNLHFARKFPRIQLQVIDAANHRSASRLSATPSHTLVSTPSTYLSNRINFSLLFGCVLTLLNFEMFSHLVRDVQVSWKNILGLSLNQSPRLSGIYIMSVGKIEY